jgi:hypothetical protein
MAATTRQLLVRQRTMLSNALRVHLAELGIVSAKGRNGVAPDHHGSPGVAGRVRHSRGAGAAVWRDRH